MAKSGAYSSKGCGSYSMSHPTLTTVHNSKGTKQSTPPIQSGEDNSYSGKGMSAPIGKGKGK